MDAYTRSSRRCNAKPNELLQNTDLILNVSPNWSRIYLFGINEPCSILVFWCRSRMDGSKGYGAVQHLVFFILLLVFRLRDGFRSATECM